MGVSRQTKKQQYPKFNKITHHNVFSYSMFIMYLIRRARLLVNFESFKARKCLHT